MDELIVKNKPKLIKWISGDPTFIVQHVQSEGFITRSEYDELMSISVPREVVIRLLDIICIKGEEVCRDFLNLLKVDDVNEGFPELRKWIKTVNTSETSTLSFPETTNSGHSGTQITSSISASGGSSVCAPVIAGSSLGAINMNMVAPSGRSDVARNYHEEPANGPIPENCQDFLKRKTSDLVQNVKNIKPIVDDLDLHSESAANVRAQTTDQDKMRKLLEYVNCESIAKRLVKALVKHERDLMNELLG